MRFSTDPITWLLLWCATVPVTDSFLSTVTVMAHCSSVVFLPLCTVYSQVAKGPDKGKIVEVVKRKLGLEQVTAISLSQMQVGTVVSSQRTTFAFTQLQ